jgi:hypothetical protein
MAGCQGNIPATLAYVRPIHLFYPLALALTSPSLQNANNIVGHSKRSFASAIVVGSGGIGGIIATTVFRQADAPKYIPGIWTTIGLQLAALVVLACSSAWFASENRKTREDRTRLIEGQQGFFYTL